MLREWLENPDDPSTPSKWIAQPEEYAVGYAGTDRNTNGGVALGYGYATDQNGRLGEDRVKFEGQTESFANSGEAYIVAGEKTGTKT